MSSQPKKSNHKISMIVAVDSKGGIGRKNQLLFHISDDLKRFKNMTTGNVIIMGRKTLESFPRKRPLPLRTNIVMSKDQMYTVPGCVVAHSLDGVLNYLNGVSSEKEIFVIGGGQIYNLFLPLCDTIYITQVDKEVEDADTFFPKLNPKEWNLAEEDISDDFYDADADVTFRYLTYHRR